MYKSTKLNPNRKLLVIILILLGILNLILIILYYKNLSINVRFTSLNHVKTFVDNSNIYPLSFNKPTLKVSNSNLPGSKIYTFNTLIAGRPFIDKQFGGYVLPVKFNSNNKDYLYFIVFGSNKNKIPILIAKNGIIPDIQQWESLSIVNLLDLFKTGDPIIVEFLNVSDKSVSFLQEALNCNSDICLNGLKLELELSKNTELLYNGLINNKSLNNNVYIGYPTKLIIYD